MKFKKMAGVVAALWWAGCSGDVMHDTQNNGGSGKFGDGDDNSSSQGGKGSDNGFAGANGDGDPLAVAPMPLRRLTRTEYDNTVKDLLGDTTRPAQSFASEARRAGGFVETLAASSVEVARYREAAESLAATTVKQRWSRVVSCTTEDEACASTFIEGFGARAFRRALTADETQEHLALYKKLRGAPISYTHKEAVQTLIAAMLQSPRFLYHWERGAGKAVVQDGAVRFTAHEAASRLSYLLWQSMPDDALFAAAKADELADAAGIAKQARRMLSDPRAADGINSFIEQILDADLLQSTEKDKTVYPKFSTALATSMQKETRAFASWAFLQAGTLDALLTSSTSFVDKPLADLYGHTDASLGTDLKKVDLDSSQRFGLLTQGTFLAVQAAPFETSPIKRGVVLLERFLCEHAPPVPDEIPALKPSRPGMQTREKFEEHTANPACGACHKAMDPLGFAFESYDGIGAFRPTEQGRPVDTTGSIELDGKTVAFKGAKELLNAMVQSQSVQRCMATQLLRFGAGRDVHDADTFSLGKATEVFRNNKRDLRELLIALITSRSFLYRAPSQGEI